MKKEILKDKIKKMQKIKNNSNQKNENEIRYKN